MTKGAIDYDYDEVIAYIPGTPCTAVNDLATNLNTLGTNLTSMQEQFHSTNLQQVLGKVYTGFSNIIGDSSKGLAKLDQEAANILNVCYNEAVSDKKIVENGTNDGSTNTPSGNNNGGSTGNPSNNNEGTSNMQTGDYTPQPVKGNISPGTTENTFQGQAYNLTDEEYKQLVALVYSEATESPGNCYSDSMGVTSTVLNRVEASGFGDGVIGVMSKSGQFHGYQNSKYNRAYNDISVVPQDMIDAINATLAGNRNTSGYYFAGHGSYSTFR